MLHDPAAVAAAVRVLAARPARVTAVDGSEVAVEARSVCVHGDTPGAVEMARAVAGALDGAGATLAPFAGA